MLGWDVLHEDTNPGGICVRGAMTDGLVAVKDTSCRLLLSEEVSVGRVSSSESKSGLSGKTPADPNSLRNVTSESMDNSYNS